MKLLKKRKRSVSVRKAAIYAIVINGLQILLMVGMMLAALLLPN